LGRIYVGKLAIGGLAGKVRCEREAEIQLIFFTRLVFESILILSQENEHGFDHKRRKSNSDQYHQLSDNSTEKAHLMSSIHATSRV